MPSTMGAETLESVTAEARASISDEADRTRAGFNSCADPATQCRPAGLDRLKEKFEFLNEYTDEFIKDTGVDVLIKAETAARKLVKYEKDKKAEDRLYSNRESLATVRVKEGQDNRLDILHAARALPGATCSAAKLWLHARSVMGSSGHPPLSTYDMSAIGLGGCVTPRGWVELHNPSSPNLSIKHFAMGSCITKPGKDEEYTDLEDLSELKAAIRVLRGAMAYVHPWNRSVDALENFLVQSSFCSKDLFGMEKQTKLLSQFTDYVLVENASRWRGMEPFLNTRELRNTWADFLGQKSASFKQNNQSNTSNQGYQGNQGNQGNRGQNQQNLLPSQKWSIPAHLFNDDICVLWNLGKCLKAPGACATKAGRALRHVCNHRPDPSKPAVICEKSHMAKLFH